MRITIDIPDELIEEAMRLGGFSTVQECVIAALELLIAKAESQEFLDRLGTFNYGLTQEDLRKLRGYDEPPADENPQEHGGESGADDS